MKRGSVFVVEDDKKTEQLLCQTLRAEGFHVKSAGTIFSAKGEISRFLPDLVILDRGLPDGDGVDFCRELRSCERTKHVPVLFLTAKNSVIDRVTGLKIGGDDYISKPFSLEELLARIEVLLRRSKNAREETPKVLQVGGIVLDIDKHECRIEGKHVKLFPKEFELLKAFMEQPGRLLSREFLSKRVWNWECYETTHTTDTTVQRLRKKLGKKADLIETVKGYGYRIRGGK